MYARNVTIHLKPNSVSEFTSTFEREILPLLRKQNGFTDEITFLAEDGRDAVAISLWDRKESAEKWAPPVRWEPRVPPRLISRSRRAFPGTKRSGWRVCTEHPAQQVTQGFLRTSSR